VLRRAPAISGVSYPTIPSRVISDCPRQTPSPRPGFVGLQEIVIRLCAVDSKPHGKSSILNTRLVGGPGFEPGASRSRTVRAAKLRQPPTRLLILSGAGVDPGFGHHQR